MAHAFLKVQNPVTVAQQCSKALFPSRQMAQKAARDHNRSEGLVAHGKGKMQAYKCKISGCGQWHLGHEQG